jgi:predicted glutamine amidotransferase
MLFASLPTSTVSRSALVRDFLQLAENGKVPRTITPGHHDGWGMALYRDSELIEWYRSEESGFTDAKRDLILADIDEKRPDALLVHVRKMTAGEPAERNSHPFVDGRFAFIHNGMLGSPDQEIFRDVDARAVGETDTERYFHLIIHELESADEHSRVRVADAFTKTVRALRSGVSYAGGSFTSASSILTDGKYAYALREFTEEHPLVKQYAAENYYTLFIGKGMDGAVYVCSEKLDIPSVSWQLLPNHSLTSIDLQKGSWSTNTV